DPSAADDLFAGRGVVEDGCLSGGDGTLRFVKDDPSVSLCLRIDRCGRRLVAIAYLHECANRFGRLIERHPVDAFRNELGLFKLVRLADDYLILRAVDLNHIQGLLVRDAESSSLADRVPM